MRISDWSSDVCSSDLYDLLFSRFVSAERNEPPDIDVDFEQERRAEVMQYVYERYGRHRAGLADRMSVVQGMSVAVGVALCGRRIHKKQTHGSCSTSAFVVQ